MTVDPYQPVSALKGVGPKLEETLQRLNIYRLIDLLLHLLQQVHNAADRVLRGRSGALRRS